MENRNPYQGWKMEKGQLILLHPGRRGDPITDEKFSVFELTMDFKL
jgi:hypothetical protein